MDGLTAHDIATAVAPRRRMALRRLLLAAACLAALATAAWWARDWWTQGRFIETTDDAYVGGDVTAIAPHIAGFVAAIAVADNQRVSAGELLLRLDPKDFVAARDQASAALAQRRAAAAALQSQLPLQAAVIRQAEADLRSAVARDDFARQESDRYAVLARTVAGSRQEAQRTESARADADAVVAASLAKQAAAVAQLDVLQHQLAGARAAEAEAEAAERIATLNLGYTEIRSPIDGYIANRAAHAGAFVTAGTYLLSVVPAASLWIDANFKEDQLARIHPGQPARIVADAAPGRVIAGHVLSLSPGTGAVFSVIPPENATGNFTKIVQRVPVRIALDGAAAALGALRPGLSAIVRIDTRE